MADANHFVRFGPWTLALDVERTKEANRALVPCSQRCGCFFCRQFREERASRKYSFFEDLKQLGLDPRRETEVAHFRELEDGSQLFYGCYHAVGTIVEGPDEGTFHRWDDDVEVRVANRREALAAHFPDPALQIEFLARFPWRGAQSVV